MFPFWPCSPPDNLHTGEPVSHTPTPPKLCTFPLSTPLGSQHVLLGVSLSALTCGSLGYCLQANIFVMFTPPKKEKKTGLNIMYHHIHTHITWTYIFLLDKINFLAVLSAPAHFLNDTLLIPLIILCVSVAIKDSTWPDARGWDASTIGFKSVVLWFSVGTEAEALGPQNGESCSQKRPGPAATELVTPRGKWPVTWPHLSHPWEFSHQRQDSHCRMCDNPGFFSSLHFQDGKRPGMKAGPSTDRKRLWRGRPSSDKLMEKPTAEGFPRPGSPERYTTRDGPAGIGGCRCAALAPLGLLHLLCWGPLPSHRAADHSHHPGLLKMPSSSPARGAPEPLGTEE
uniref:uncharacterized protein LOC129510320 isoform X2 n=1 Tax=Nyctereutes procyonoides TaxID=34880 RepID=UPI00244506FD|nr:uncharacterized protein LOC129510320 isoform X2 [Nyctereutes procyonoides]